MACPYVSERLILPQVLFEGQQRCSNLILLFGNLLGVNSVVQDHTVVHVTLGHQIRGIEALLEELFVGHTFRFGLNNVEVGENVMTKAPAHDKEMENLVGAKILMA